MEIPCEGCVLIVLCKHRTYSELFDTCSLIREYIPYIKHHRNDKKVEKLSNTLKSSKWYYQCGIGIYIKESKHWIRLHPQSITEYNKEIKQWK